MSPRKKKGEDLAQQEQPTPTGQEGVVATEEADVSDMSLDDGFGGQMSVRKAENFWPSAKRLFGLLAPHKAALAVVFVLVSVSVVFNVIAPKVMGRAMDIILGGLVGRELPAGMSKEQVIEAARASGDNDGADRLEHMIFTPGQGVDFTQLGTVLLWVLGLYLLASVFMWAQGWLLNRLVMSVVRNLRERVEEKINRLPLNYFDTRQRGDVLSRVTNDVDNIQQALQQALSQLVSSIMTVIGIIIMMFVVSWQLALIALLALPLTGVVMGLIGKPSQKKFVAQWKSTGALNGHIEESFSGHELVKLFGREKEMGERFDERNESLFKAAFGAQALSMSMMPIMMFVSYLSYVGIAVVGGLRVAAGQMSLGDATAFIQYSRQFTQPLSEIAGIANMFQSGVAAAERTFELLDAEEEEPEKSDAHLPERTDGRVQFQGVSFSYSEDKPLIEDLSLEAAPGHTVAIVGPTGAGKTTLVNLVMRFYELNGGRILLDGVDTRDITRHELRGQVGMVLQDAWLFGGTIMENIRYGRLDATDEEVIAAAKATYVDRFVRALPDGYDTVLDEEATNVSAGERQLITIARAFVSNPSLLILDEATSSVDTRTELLVQQAMKALRSDRTSFVIAHRLSTIRDADTILVMEAGRIVEQGTHEDLLKGHGAYHRLYMSQFVGPADTEVAEEELVSAELADEARLGDAVREAVQASTGALPVVEQNRGGSAAGAAATPLAEPGPDVEAAAVREVRRADVGEVPSDLWLGDAHDAKTPEEVPPTGALPVIGAWTPAPPTDESDPWIGTEAEQPAAIVDDVPRVPLTAEDEAAAPAEETTFAPAVDPGAAEAVTEVAPDDDAESGTPDLSALSTEPRTPVSDSGEVPSEPRFPSGQDSAALSREEVNEILDAEAAEAARVQGKLDRRNGKRQYDDMTGDERSRGRAGRHADSSRPVDSHDASTDYVDDEDAPGVSGLDDKA